MSDKKINVFIIYNPMKPNSREEAEVLWQPDCKLDYYLKDLPTEAEWLVVKNGVCCKKEDWPNIDVAENDYLALMPIITRGGGGGGGKQILRLAAMIAVTSFAPVIGGQIAGSMGFASSSAIAGTAFAGGGVGASIGAAMGYYAVTAAVYAGGMLLINSVFPVAQAKNNSSSYDTTSENQTFGIDGPKSTSKEGLPLNLVYGQFRTGGNLVNVKTVNTGDTQVLYLMQAVSEGEVESITDFYFGEQPISNYDSVSTQYRLGTDNQEVISWFDDTTLMYNLEYQLTTSFHIYDTVGEIDKFRVDLQFPNGLVEYNSAGTKLETSINVEIEYKKKTDSAWTSLSGPITITGKQSTVLRRSFESGLLDLDEYNIRVRRTTDKSTDDLLRNDCYWSDAVEIKTQDISYNHTALFATSVTLSGQLSATPSVTALVKGIKVNKYDSSGNVTIKEWSDNPAWVTIDVLTNARYGVGLPINRIDLDSFIDWAEYCEDNNITFNGVFDATSNMWDTLQPLMTLGQSQLLLMGTKISVVIDKKDTPKMMFNNTNMIDGSFSINWMPIAERINSLDVIYYDKDDFYKKKTIQIADNESIALGQEIKKTEISGFGVTNKTLAGYLANRHLVNNKFIKQTVSFGVPVEALGCTVGDVIIVQNDMPQWGYGGKLKSGNTVNSLNLDRDVTFNPTKNYSILIHHPTIKRYEMTIAAAVGSSIFVSSSQIPTPISPVKRAIVGEVDAQVLNIISGNPYTEIALDRSGIAIAGQTIELWDTDILDTVSVTNAGTTTDVVSTTTNLQAAPEQYCDWLFGEINVSQKKFRITRIDGYNDFIRTITAIEYYDELYDEAALTDNIPNYSDLSNTIGVVRNLNVGEELVRAGNSFITNVVVSWDLPLEGNYEGAEVYVRNGTSIFEKVGQVSNVLTNFTFTYEEGETVEIKVVALDSLGRKADFLLSPSTSYYILGKTKKPEPPTNLAVQKSKYGVVINWTLCPEVDVIGYTVKEGIGWDDPSAITIVERFAGSKYIQEHADGGNKNYMVKTIDSSGNESINPVSLAVYLAPPNDVEDFVGVYNDSSVDLRWANTDESAVKFQIRQGLSWDSATVLGEVSGYQFSIVSGGYFNTKFWIKAIDFSGVFSDNAVWVIPDIQELQLHNIIQEQEESTTFDNSKINCYVDDDGFLTMNDDLPYCEYAFPVGIDANLYSRVLLRDDLTTSSFSPTWDECDFTWEDTLADVPWELQGNADSFTVNRQISIASDSSYPVDLIEAFSFYNTLEGKNGTTPAHNDTPKYESGRYEDGLVVDDMQNLDYNIAIGETFSIRFWVRPKDLISGRYLSLLTDDGHWLRLNYNETNQLFYLVDDSGNTLSVPATFKVEEPVLLGLIQTETNRKMMIGLTKDLQTLTDEDDFLPIGSITILKFY